MDEFDDGSEYVRIGFGGNPVTEIEDVPGGGIALGTDAAHGRGEFFGRGRQQRRVEVALQWHIATEQGTGFA